MERLQTWLVALAGGGVYQHSGGFDPYLIVGQIVCVQATYYLTLGLALWFFEALVGQRVSMDSFFAYAHVNATSWSGWMQVLALLVNSLFVAISLVFVVGKAKKCLDFASTVSILHLCVSAFWGFPASFTWWAVHVVALIISTVAAENWCLQVQMQEIPLGGAGRRKRGATGHAEV